MNRTTSFDCQTTTKRKALILRYCLYGMKYNLEFFKPVSWSHLVVRWTAERGTIPLQLWNLIKATRAGGKSLDIFFFDFLIIPHLFRVALFIVKILVLGRCLTLEWLLVLLMFNRNKKNILHVGGASTRPLLQQIPPNLLKYTLHM